MSSILTQVKGTGLKTTRDFIKERFPDKYNEWYNSLPETSKELYSGIVSASEWYPLREGYVIPIDTLIKTCYGGNEREGGEQLGEYSAEVALKGIYRVFLLIASPQFLMKRATSIMSAYYQPSEINLIESSKNRVVLQISSLSDITLALEYRIAGWCCKALELANCKNLKYSFLKHLSKGMEATEIEFMWE